MQSFLVEYDFKTLRLNLIKNGRLRREYNCLPYMITLPLSRPLDDPGPPFQPDPIYNQTILKSTSSTSQGWLNFIPIYNPQLNIITIVIHTLVINKYSYNYDIIVNVIRKGDTDVPLRFMAQNPFSLLASNMNDIYGDETVFRTRNGKQIKFTITREYQFFYINYPTTNFELDISITTSTKKGPCLICYKNNNNCNNINNNINNNNDNNINNNYNINIDRNRCSKKCNKGGQIKCNKGTCNCFDVNGNGYLMVEDQGDIINVPVYTSRVIGNTIYTYLYPEFSYLRDLFYNITLANSLPVPENLPAIGGSLIPTTIGLERQVILAVESQVLTAEITEIVACGALWLLFTQVNPGSLFDLKNSPFCPTFNYIGERRTYGSHLRYSWPTTEFLFSSPGSDGPVTVGMVAFKYINLPDDQQGPPPLPSPFNLEPRLITENIDGVDVNTYKYRLLQGSYDHTSEFEYIGFRFKFFGRLLDVIPGVTFPITVTKVPNTA